MTYEKVKRVHLKFLMELGDIVGCAFKDPKYLPLFSQKVRISVNFCVW